MATTSTSFVGLQTSSITGYSASYAGWSTSCGGYARNLEQSGPLELRGKAGVIPVIVRAYCKVTGGTGTIRFASAAYSIRDITTTSTSYGWISGCGWLRCGTGVADNIPLEVLIKISSGAHTLSVLYLSVEYGTGYITED